MVVNSPNTTKVGSCGVRQTVPKPVPKNKWFHVEAWYKAAKTNGAVKIWQDGQLIFDLSGPNFDTLTRNCTSPAGQRSANTSLYWVVGSYSAPQLDTTQSLYLDDALITDYQVSAALGGSLRGDLNGSSTVDLTDLRLLIQMIVGQTSPDLGVADLDSDGQLTLGDVRALINILITP